MEPTLGKILIPEGYTLEQIAQAVTVNSAGKDEKTPFTKDEFMKTVQDQAFIEKMKEKFPKLLASLPSKDSGVKYQLEGYLFPATYEYTKKTTVESLIETMLSTTNTQLEPLYEQIQANGLTVNETLSLAAIVEK
ncbi:endolytic transglycosylase MltG, partial [Proteus terrae]|nr:endolytic transglycosylase MltG [Proteus terrae]